MSTNGDYHPDHAPEPLDPSQVYVINRCNGHRDLSVHAEGCDGSCGTDELTGVEIELHNEHNNWGIAGMTTRGVPIDMFDLQMKVDSLVAALTELLGIDGEQLNQLYREHKLKVMRGIREANEASVKARRLDAIKRPLFGPNGEILG